MGGLVQRTLLAQMAHQTVLVDKRLRTSNVEDDRNVFFVGISVRIDILVVAELRYGQS